MSAWHDGDESGEGGDRFETWGDEDDWRERVLDFLWAVRWVVYYQGIIRGMGWLRFWCKWMAPGVVLALAIFAASRHLTPYPLLLLVAGMLGAAFLLWLAYRRDVRWTGISITYHCFACGRLVTIPLRGSENWARCPLCRKRVALTISH